ncbi:MAG: DUF1543 domain-containing protein [Pseudobdellovibrionaceae bacterium]
MKLFSIHCGYYDEDIFNGIYEFHINIPVAAVSVEEAKVEVRKIPVFKKKKMHIDGIEEIKSVNGYRIELISDAENIGTIIEQHLHRDL